MRIQYDSSDLEVLPCFTFVANDVDDQEQLTDMVSWLSSLNIRTSRTVIRSADGSKMVCLLVNEQPTKPVVQQPSKPVTQPTKPTPQQQSEDEESEEESDEESENEVVPKTKPQPVVQKTVIKKK